MADRSNLVVGSRALISVKAAYLFRWHQIERSRNGNGKEHDLPLVR
jgi:hypothetical protein